MSASSGSTPSPSPPVESAATSSGMEESSNSNTPSWQESILKRFRLKMKMKYEYQAKERLYRNKMRKEMKDDPFQPENFGDLACMEKFNDSLWNSAVVSVSLFKEDVLVYACSGTAVRHFHNNMRGHHAIFVTSARLAQKFNDNRTRDDNLRIEVRSVDDKIMHGFLGLYDKKKGIAIVTSFTLKCVFLLNTLDAKDLPGGTINDNLFVFGRATSGTLMGANCSHPVLDGKKLASVNCKITESGHGGPVLYIAPDGSGHIVGLTVESCEGKITLLPRKILHNWLHRLLQITSKTSHFRGYSLPKGVKAVIPSGFMVESKILQSEGYPLPPPLLFELNGRIASRFEESFGEFYYWEGYLFGPTNDCRKNPIWDQLGETLTQEISQSVVSIASFKDNKRCFACTGLLITGRNCTLVLTSASLVRTGDAEGEIDENLMIEVFLPRNHVVQGTLKLYHQNYNIVIVNLNEDLATDICPKDILNIGESRNKKKSVAPTRRPAVGLVVAAIGRSIKESDGLLMASMGEVKGKYKVVKSTCLTKQPDCADLLLSTCQIKKVGIGGPLIDLDGRFIGMNFYNESKTSPFLPTKVILEVLRKGFAQLESSTSGHPVNMEEDIGGHFSSKTLKRKRNQWPVSEPYWYFAGQGNRNCPGPFVGKVLM